MENDDGESLNGGSRIIWTAPADGDYFLEVRSFDQDNQGGTYTLSLGYVYILTVPSISGFYVGDIISIEDGLSAEIELKLEEERGDVFGYLDVYEPRVGSGELESGSYSQRALNFGVRSSVEGLPFACDYFAHVFPEEGVLKGNYECFLRGGEFVDSGEWFAERQ